MRKKAKGIFSAILLAVLLLVLAASPVYAAEGDTLDPEVYDVEALEAGSTDWDTSIQLMNDYEPNVLIIKFKDRSEFPDKEKQYDNEVGKVLGTGFELIHDNTYLVKVEDLSKNPNSVLNRFKNNRFIEYVEPNYLGDIETAPEDPNYKVYGSAFAKLINAEAGWDIITDSNVLVALVDSGYSGNTDLPSVKGYSIYNKNTDLTDKAGHGTQVAGALGAIANNGDKNVGVVWNANMMPVKITETTSVSVANVASAITYAANNGAKVINLSLSFSTSSSTLKNAVNYAYNKGCVLVAATGNGSKASVNYPAAYANVLGVGGSANGTARYASTNYGTGIDVLASYSWYATTVRNNNTISSGTSISSPQVAGLAALVWELAPGLTNAQVMQLIRDNTNRADGKWDAQTGYGTIDMGKTLAAAQALGGKAPATKDTEAPKIALKGTAIVELTEGDAYVEPGYTAKDNIDGDVTASVVVTGTAATAYAGEYVLTYTVYDKAGNVGTATRTIVVKAAAEPDAPAPTITQVGSNPIVLHLGGTPYTEQGAIAHDELDGDISAFVVTTGNVDTSRAGTYQVNYSVTNSAGQSASITREVRVLSPKASAGRTPFSFSGQGKVGAVANYNVQANGPGNMELTVSDLNKGTLHVRVTDSTGSEVFNKSFPGNTTDSFPVSAGACFVEASIVGGNGNVKYSITLLSPDGGSATFDEPEVPLGGVLAGSASGGVWNVLALVGDVVILAGIGVVIVLLVKKRRPEKEMASKESGDQ